MKIKGFHSPKLKRQSAMPGPRLEFRVIAGKDPKPERIMIPLQQVLDWRKVSVCHKKFQEDSEQVTKFLIRIFQFFVYFSSVYQDYRNPIYL